MIHILSAFYISAISSLSMITIISIIRSAYLEIILFHCFFCVCVSKTKTLLFINEKHFQFCLSFFLKIIIKFANKYNYIESIFRPNIFSPRQQKMNRTLISIDLNRNYFFFEWLSSLDAPMNILFILKQYEKNKCYFDSRLKSDSALEA